MFTSPAQPQPWPSSPILFTLLPGPDRKRSEHTYRYRLVYRGGDEPGCAMLWEVAGGRLSYQVAVEREEAGGVRLHCTCADAVYRAEDEGRHCKHILGLLQFASPGSGLVAVPPEPACLRMERALTAAAPVSPAA